MARLIPPAWFDDALLLRAQGLTVRATTEELKRKGHKCSHQHVWYWTSVQGFKRLKFIRRVR
jgi:hypothetical protein